jgi:large subunit ribosomal protein L31
VKKDIHPKNYRPVVFQDSNDGSTFLTRSTVDAEETITLDGTEYPLVKVHISSASHPYFTGQEKLVDVEGRVDKFKARQAAAEKARAEMTGKKPKVRKSSAKKTEQKLGAKPATKKSAQG